MFMSHLTAICILEENSVVSKKAFHHVIHHTLSGKILNNLQS